MCKPNKTVKKEDLIEKIAQNAEMTKGSALKALDSVIAAIMEAVATGETIRLTGFGSFSVSTRKAREGRNPQTGEVIQISEKKHIAFKAGKTFADLVSGHNIEE
jgi:DNA-binding protein HU-beta